MDGGWRDEGKDAGWIGVTWRGGRGTLRKDSWGGGRKVGEGGMTLGRKEDGWMQEV